MEKDCRGVWISTFVVAGRVGISRLIPAVCALFAFVSLMDVDVGRVQLADML
jgi:hypothetical protein